MANLTGVVAVCGYSIICTYVIIKLVNAFMPVRVSEDAEGEGLDRAQHGEFARVNNTK
jgi:Amt family ammonium transporter